MHRSKLVLGTVFVSAVALATVPASAAAREDLATVRVGTTAVVWQPAVAYDSLVLTLSGPHGVTRHEFDAATMPSLDIFATDGFPLPDGPYTWEIEARPAVGPEVERTLDAARATGDHAEVDALRQRGALPSEPLVQSGHFTVAGGAFVDPSLDEADTAPAAASAPLSANTGDGGEIVSMSAADQVILDDLIVDGSACIGQDCVNGESFGFDTIRIKENNTRIKFDDTSNSGSFPFVDWQLTANESSNGGANKFSIDDVTNGRTPFTVEANAPNNSLYVDDAGNLGLNTSAPVVEIHLRDGDSPALRLEQDGSSGFTPQTWDVAGNEANFFVRDATNGSKIPFKIIPNAPTNSLYVHSSGNLGLGTTSPDAKLDVDGGAAVIQSTTGVANLQVNENSATQMSRTLMELQNNGQLFFQMTRTDGSSGTWSMVHDGGQLNITKGGSGVNEMSISDGGDLTIAGDLTITGTCNGCDAVFDPTWAVPTIEQHAAEMWTHSHLPGVGPTPEGKAPIRVFQKTTGMLQELEIAHIYIQQLHERLEALEAKLEEQSEEK